MKKEYKNFEDLLKDNSSSKEETETLKIINKLNVVKRKGYLTKKEFMIICMWKSARPKQRYLSNSEEKIIKISKQVLGTKYEKRKIELLTSLNGVSIPVASAILTLVDPKNYGVIDIRVWQTLFLYGVIKTKPSGIGFNFNNWYTYLMKLRYYAKKLKVKARDIERNLYDYHKAIQEGTLYK